MKVHAVTHVGLVRQSNEDLFLARRFDENAWLVAVADGMGGQAGGEIAAEIAVTSLEDFDPHSVSIQDHLMALVRSADNRIRERAARDEQLQGMGTTLTAAFLQGNAAHWIHVGDSRLYLFRGGELRAVTEDHTIPGALVSEGTISREEARVHPMRHVLLDCVGCGSPDPDEGRFRLEHGDLLLLSTDGLHDHTPERVIESVLASGTPLEEKIEALVRKALDAGGADNITVLGALV